MTWAQSIPVALTAALVLIVPGAIVALLLRLRGLWLLAGGIAISVSLIVVASVAAPFLGLSWGITPVALLSGIAIVCAAIFGHFVRPDAIGKHSLSATVTLAIGVLSGMAVTARALMHGFGSPENFAQRYDNFYHLNGVQYILDGGNASPLYLGTMTGGTFYPSGWHAYVSLVADLSGSGVVVATTVSSLVVAALVWIPAITLLTTTMFPKPWLAAAAGTGVLAATLPSFPYLPLHYGVLLGFFFAIALVPVAVALAWRIASGAVSGRAAWWQAIVLGALILPGMTGVHPSAIPAIAVLTVPIGVLLLSKGFRAVNSRAGMVRMLLCTAAYAAAVTAVLLKLRPGGGSHWPRLTSMSNALGEAMTGSAFGYPEAWLAAALAAIGVVVTILRPSTARLSALALAAVGVVFYGVVAAEENETLRLFLTGPWYVNAPRLAAIWTIAYLPLVIVGLGVLVDAIAKLIRTLGLTFRKPWAAIIAPLSAIALVATLIPLADGKGMELSDVHVQSIYIPRDANDDPEVLSTDELALIKRIPDLVPEGAVIAGDPWTGTSLAYALSGRQVTFPHLQMWPNPPAEFLGDKLSQGETPELCKALEASGVTYVLDFSGEGDFMEADRQYPGFDNLERADTVRLVDQVGRARLFQVTACGLGSHS